MKNLAKLLLVSILAGVLTLGSYKMFLEDDPLLFNETPQLPAYTPVNFNPGSGLNPDFTEAARRSVNAVVHVMNLAVTRSPFSRGNQSLQGTGSGVIVSPDGYIVTNNHVIQNANSLQVTLNNNETYTAEVIGSHPEADIALLKINASEDLAYLPFGNSNNAQVGEWVLAVGNPFNLTSTVTAGIISAKSRNLGINPNGPSSFIQTDAAVNPGNSGGALVNIQGELIGINTAITSQTGTYVGYAFAVPSNNARKIVEDIMEYGDVQRGILGIIGGEIPRELEVSQGVYVSEVTPGSGAAEAGLRQNDVIVQIDNVDINKFADLTGYINSKRPDDVVHVSVLRDGKKREVNVRLTKYETFQIKAIGLEVTNATEADLKKNKVPYGVKISRGLTPQMQSEELRGVIITAIDGKPVRSIEDVEAIVNNRDYYAPMTINFIGPNGQSQKYIWR